MILALATRTACALGDGFFERVFVCAPVVGIMSSCVGAIEPCATGCTLMGSVDVGLRLGIMDNSQMQSSFTALKGPSRGWTNLRARSWSSVKHIPSCG